MYQRATEPPPGAAPATFRPAGEAELLRFPVTIGDALRGGEESLAFSGVENPRRDVAALLAHCLGVEPWRLLLEREKVLSSAESAKFDRFLAARRARRPLAYILGWAGFHDLILDCDPRALIPRPETELLVEQAGEFLAGKAGVEVIEIGCGSGAVGLALARQLPAARIGASEISPASLALARENAARLGLEERIDLRVGDLFDPWDDRRGRGVDLVVSNPPYLSRNELAAAPPEVQRYEPGKALDGGEDGLEVIRRLVAETPFYLRPGGRLMIEIGSAQGDSVRALAISNGPGVPAVIDRSEIPRRRSGEAGQSHPGGQEADRSGAGDCFAPAALAMTDSAAGGLEFIELVKDYCGRDRVAIFGKRNGEY